uniref:TPT domain-containing protein n=1 Tax=Panagrellus redivivus TaxID=6233 RepID=A0A7E4UTY3_PANRE
MFKVLFMVMLYYPLSIGLTFYQKWFIRNYRYPLFIVTGHYVTKLALATGVRSFYEIINGTRRVRISWREQLNWLLPIGICASLDIGLSNWALEYVTVSLYTMAKSSSILFIVGFSLLLGLERWRFVLGISAALIASGLCLFTWQSTQLDLLGLLLVELAALCTGIRWTVSQFIMQRDDSPTPLRHPLDMVAHVQPWMLMAILPMVYLFEGHELTPNTISIFAGTYQPGRIFAGIVFGGVLAFLMEISEYLLLVHTSGITLNIFGIIKSSNKATNQSLGSFGRKFERGRPRMLSVRFPTLYNVNTTIRFNLKTSFNNVSEDTERLFAGESELDHGVAVVFAAEGVHQLAD